MQSIAPLTHADFKAKGKKPVSKLEVFIAAWEDICDLSGKNYLISANYSKGQRKQTYKPVAATFSAVIDNIDGLFHPQNNDSAYKDYFRVGRKIRFSTGFTKNSTDYLWQWFIGVISKVDVDNANRQVMIQGFDYMQYLSEVKMKSPDNYWGTTVTKSGVEGQAEYSMPADCNGVYLAYFDGTPMYEGKHWVYDRTENEFVFLQGYVPIAAGVNNLVIYYFTDQVVENVVADILVSAGLYANQAAALAAMDYTATGVTIERVMFLNGLNYLTAIQKLCERVDYRFHFGYNATPIFKPIAASAGWLNRKFLFTKNLIVEPNYFENIDEVRNSIRVEGEKYSVGDETFVFSSNSNILNSETGKYSNTAFGYLALYSLTTGIQNVAVGAQALTSLTDGLYNVALGYQALHTSVSDDYNVALGYQVLYTNNGGYANVGIGKFALYLNTSGLQNVAIGELTLYSNTTGFQNIAIGRQTLWNCTEGHSNIGMGYNALYDLTTGIGNTAIGGISLANITTADTNTALGYLAGFTCITGASNVFLGLKAGYFETGSDKLYISNSDTTTPLIYGDFANFNLGINLKSFGNGQGCISIANAVAVPSANPVGGGILYVEAGSLKYRGSSGTITVLGAA